MAELLTKSDGLDIQEHVFQGHASNYTLMRSKINQKLQQFTFLYYRSKN